MPQPHHQNYESIPGYEHDAYGGASPAPQTGASGYELDRLPPSNSNEQLYSNPFAGGSSTSQAYPADMNRPNQYYNVDNQDAYPAGGYPSHNAGFSDSAQGGYGAGAGAGAGGYGGNMTADEIWAADHGKERVPSSYQYNDTAARGYGGGGGGGRNKKTWWIVGGVLLLIVAAAVAIPVAITQTRQNHGSSHKSGNSTSASGTGLSDPNDPSNFEKDSRLHNVFWGMCYQPDGVIPPDCSAKQEDVTRDIQILSQLTTRLRLYGANCNMTALVLQAIQDTKVDMTIYPAIYIDSNTQAYHDQTDAVISAFKTYGVDHVDGLAVGNEFLLNTGVSAPSGSAYLKEVKTLLGYVKEVKDQVDALGLSKTIPVGTGDAGSLMSETLGEGLDFYMANVHPWFGKVPIDQSADWTWEYFTENDVKPAEAAPNKPATYIAETGWPTKYSPPQGDATGQDSGNSPSDATEANLQTFLDTFVCQANSNKTQYFYFEPFDQAWKEKLYGGVEPYWGLFDSNRTLKNIQIPTCS